MEVFVFNDIFVFGELLQRRWKRFRAGLAIAILRNGVLLSHCFPVSGKHGHALTVIAVEAYDGGYVGVVAVCGLRSVPGMACTAVVCGKDPMMGALDRLECLGEALWGSSLSLFEK